MKYFVHTKKDVEGDYEVHTKDCHKLPVVANRKELGEFSSCAPAVTEAKRLGYTPTNGCIHCCKPCHTS